MTLDMNLIDFFNSFTGIFSSPWFPSRQQNTWIYRRITWTTRPLKYLHVHTRESYLNVWFQYAQHTMLDTFSYELGITPQPILDQLWIALPSLRELFGFAGGWNQVKKETWRYLFTYLSSESHK